MSDTKFSVQTSKKARAQCELQYMSDTVPYSNCTA